MHVSREVFMGVLENVSPGLTSKELVAQSSCFIFKDGMVFTFNEEILCAATSPLGATFSGAVTARPLLDLLSQLPDKDFEVSTLMNKETGKASDMQIRSTQGKRKSKVRMEADVVSPVGLVWDERPTEWKPLDNEFTEALKIVNVCAARSGTDYKLTCVHIAAEFVEACDGHQIARYPVKTELSEDVLVRAESIQKAITLAPVEVAETQSYLWFKGAKGVIFACRRFIDDYADFTEYTKRQNGKQLVFPEGLEEVLKRAEVFTAENTVGNAVRVDIRGKEIQILGQGAHGEHVERKDCLYDGDPLSFYIAPSLLLSISKKSLNCILVPASEQLEFARLVLDHAKFFYCTSVVPPEKLLAGEEQKAN
jgi:DNA polymerase III sliding clamp (beta) subunit (PCNA family)